MGWDGVECVREWRALVWGGRVWVGMGMNMVEKVAPWWGFCAGWDAVGSGQQQWCRRGSIGGAEAGAEAGARVQRHCSQARAAARQTPLHAHTNVQCSPSPSARCRPPHSLHRNERRWGSVGTVQVVCQWVYGPRTWYASWELEKVLLHDLLHGNVEWPC